MRATLAMINSQLPVHSVHCIGESFSPHRQLSFLQHAFSLPGLIMRGVVAVSALFAVYGGLLLSQTHAHTGLAVPRSRESHPTDLSLAGRGSIEDKENKVACINKNYVTPPTEVKAGEMMPVQYWRNNHIGGFVRWSLIKRGEPETIENFDKNVFYYTCQESGDECKPLGDKQYPDHKFYLNQDDNTGGQTFKIKCGKEIRVPDWLEDGEYVLQYTNFATGHSYGDPGQTTPMYRACADIKITGSKKAKKPDCPTFVGGDRASNKEGKKDVCAYFISNTFPSVMKSIKGDKEVEEAYKFGVPAEWEKCTKDHPPATDPPATKAPETKAPDTPAPVKEPTSPKMTPAPPSKGSDDGPGTVSPAKETTEAPAKKTKTIFVDENGKRLSAEEYAALIAGTSSKDDGDNDGEDDLDDMLDDLVRLADGGRKKKHKRKKRSSDDDDW